jgi:hypothetical protein
MRLTVIGISAVALAALTMACSDDFPTLSSTAAKETLGAVLSPANEVPAVTGTTSSGTASIIFMDANTMRFNVQVTTIDSVTQSHIHAGVAGSNGPIMVWLYPASRTISTTNLGRLTGVLRQADLTRASVYQAPYTFDSVATRVRAGTAYVNVHTRRAPGGEIRGQTTPQ